MTDPLAELDDPGEGVDDEKTAPRGPGQKQAAIVGAKIDSAADGAGDNGRSVSVLCGNGSIAERCGHLDRRNGRAARLTGPWSWPNPPLTWPSRVAEARLAPSVAATLRSPVLNLDLPSASSPQDSLTPSLLTSQSNSFFRLRKLERGAQKKGREIPAEF